MAYLDRVLHSSLLLAGGALLLPGCPDNPVSPSDTDPGTTGTTGIDTESSCTPGESQSCTCPDGSQSTQICSASGAGFSECECDGLDTGSSTSEPPTTSSSGGEDTTTTAGMPCTTDEECPVAKAECWVGVCDDDGMCIEDHAVFDTPCGDPNADECTAADSCNNGECMPNDVDDGLTCGACASGQCACAAGTCDECAAFAPTNNFVTTRSIVGWELTGDWALRRETPQSQPEVQTYFPGQVLGTDGNRTAPFPGAEIEVSYARTPPVVLPETIAFLSWNIDEGGGASDNKTIRASVDGGATWQVLADCATDPVHVFCQYTAQADPGIWGLAQIPVPLPLQGQVGIVEFGYDTGDACCDFEKGWYIDSLNIATECACLVNADCEAFTDVCGTGYCQASGECGLLPMPDDTACGDPLDNDCNGADTCDGVGYCRDNMAATGLNLCGDCPGGAGCSYCDDGQCLDCMSFTDFSDFSNPAGTEGWVVNSFEGTPDWRLYDEAPPNENIGSLPVPFPNAPVYGIDGNRNMPYPGSESEHSEVITNVGAVPSEVTFISWNVDEGSFFDTKRIDISVDGGATWNNLVDCEAGALQPFCDFVDDGRAADDWDLITIDTSMWEGQAGQLRFMYQTGDSCCGFERGWYIDDLSFASFCDDQPFGP